MFYVHTGSMARRTNAQLQAELDALKNELNATRDERDAAQAKLDSATLVQWSARIPKTLRDEVHALRGEQSAQDVTAAALQTWVDTARARTATAAE